MFEADSRSGEPSAASTEESRSSCNDCAGGLAEVESRVEHDPVASHAGVEGALAPFDEEVAYGRGHVVVVGMGVGDPGSQTDVRGDDGGLRLRGEREVVRVGETTDVVAHAGAFGEARPRRRTPATCRC